MNKFNSKKKKLIATTLISVLLFAISVPAYAGHHINEISYKLSNGDYTRIYGSLDVSWPSNPDKADAVTDYVALEKAKNLIISNRDLYVALKYDQGKSDPWHFLAENRGHKKASVSKRKDADAFKSYSTIINPSTGACVVQVAVLSERW